MRRWSSSHFEGEPLTIGAHDQGLYTRALQFVPDLPSLAARHPAYPFLLESTARGPLGRNSLLLRPDSETPPLVLDRSGGGSSPFLQQFDQWFRRNGVRGEVSPTLPFIGGWFLYLSYELAGEIEPVLSLPPASTALPTALAVRCPGAVMIRHDQEPAATVIAESPELLEQMYTELAHWQPAEPAADPITDCEVSLQAEPDAHFIAAVERILEYLQAGDVFQVNISRAWRGHTRGRPDLDSLYRRLRQSNPAPFSGLMRWKDNALLSSSPERLVEVRGREVQTRPIAGTYPRGHDAASDEALSRDLLAHPKERAEHVMLVDLGRNDLGRVCEPGSVEVSELMVVETYAHVHHIVSNVRGRLREGTLPGEIIAAVFPGGTITGCPKVRCMQIIAELEQSGRGFYTGSMGYIGRDGQMDLNILIRSMLVEQGSVTLRTGAGIVADSVPDRELAETRAKARGLLRVFGRDDD